MAVFEDRSRRLHTTRSPQFLGLRTQLGLWSLSDYGSDVIIGVLDTGVSPNRRSFSDRSLPAIPSRWRGGCDSGPGFPSFTCNKKLIGARVFGNGHAAAAALNESVEFMSPRDADGHGTHTASTAAGSIAFDASMDGFALGVAKGVAPKSRIAVYKVCFKGSGCMDSDILAGFDRAVADGVDVLSVSIGGGEGVSAPFYLDPIAIGAYGAVARGVFVAASAGNDGPGLMSASNLAPWLTTVGATTIDRNFPADVVLGDGRHLTGVSLYSGKSLSESEMLPVVYPGNSGSLSAALCMEDSLEPMVVAGKIVICDRGSNPRVSKGLAVKQAGGAAMILTNTAGSGEGLVGDSHVLPACAVGAEEGDALKAYVNSTGNPSATIVFRGTVVGVKPAPVLASFSARGPNGLTPEILKPDLVAPGVNILAAWTDATGPTGLTSDRRRPEFNILSGTSMACPHVAGAAALLKSAHPGWSPAAIRSAMMTTAAIFDNRGAPITDESANRRALTAFDFGAGQLDLSRAMNPGLIYDITSDDYVAFLCSVGYDARTIQVITQNQVTCPAMPRHGPSHLNYPAFSIVFDGGNIRKNQSMTARRTLTNVGESAEIVYLSRVDMAAAGSSGISVSVKPTKLSFSTAVTRRSFAVTVTTTSPATDPVYGHIVWSSDTAEVRTAIMVSWMRLV